MQTLVSKRAALLKPSPSTALANSLLAPSVPSRCLIHLNDGEFDLPPHTSVLNATQSALLDGRTRYDDVKGLWTLRQRICDELLRNSGVKADPEEILVTNGSSQAIYEIFQCYISPGDQVLIPNPAWPTYAHGIRMAGGEADCYACNNSEIDFDQLNSVAKSNLRMIVVNSPHNPTGVVLSRSSINGLVDFAERRNILILSDEAYYGLFHSSVEQASTIAINPSDGARVLTTRSFSKAYSMSGFRIGYLYAHREIIDRCAVLHSHLSDHVNTFAQYGAAAALDLPVSFMLERSRELEQRQVKAFTSISSVLPCVRPAGGFYIFPCLRPILGGRWKTAHQFAAEFLLERGVAILPGEGFGVPDHCRISVASANCGLIAEAMERMIDFINLGSATRA